MAFNNNILNKAQPFNDDNLDILSDHVPVGLNIKNYDITILIYNISNNIHHTYFTKGGPFLKTQLNKVYNPENSHIFFENKNKILVEEINNAIKKVDIIVIVENSKRFINLLNNKNIIYKDYPESQDWNITSILYNPEKIKLLKSEIKEIVGENSRKIDVPIGFFEKCGKKYTICGIHAPGNLQQFPKESFQAYKEMIEKMVEEIKEENLILCGDFNSYPQKIKEVFGEKYEYYVSDYPTHQTPYENMIGCYDLFLVYNDNLNDNLNNNLNNKLSCDVMNEKEISELFIEAGNLIKGLYENLEKY